MSFDSHSLERLRKLGRQLPNSLPKPNSSSKSNLEKQRKLHPIENEQNPQKLFQELIKASPDGKIPSHLLERLKKAEQLNLQEANINKLNSEHINKSNSQKAFKSVGQQDDLYIAFKQLLLEEDDDDNEIN